MQKYKLAVAASATAYDALEELDRIVQAYYDEGYAGEHKAQLYQSPCGGLHVAYKELVKYEPEDDDYETGFVKRNAANNAATGAVDAATGEITTATKWFITTAKSKLPDVVSVY